MDRVDAHRDEQWPQDGTQDQDRRPRIQEHADEKQEQVAEKQQQVDVVRRAHHAASNHTGESRDRDDPGKYD